MTQAVSMKDLGLQIKDMAEDLSFSQMVINIKENMKMEKHMEKEHIHGEIMKYMMENGNVGKKMDMAFGRVFKEIVILVSGRIVKQKDMEYIHGLMEIDMKENGKNA